MTSRSGTNSYLDGIREKSGVKTPDREIHIVLTGDTEPEKSGNDTSLPPFMRDLAPEDRMFSFMINPDQMRTNYQKIINRFYTRGGWILEHVSDELPKMTLSGSTSSFRNPIIEETNITSRRAGQTSFLTNDNRSYSAGYRNLLHLIDVYRNNGRIFYVDPFYGDVKDSAFSTFSYAQRIKTSTPVQIIYGDEEIYEGFFNSMSTTEDANTPYYINFSLDFSITRIIEAWRIPKK